MHGGDQPVAERVRDHLEHLVAQRHAPRVRRGDQRERLAGERVQVQSRQPVPFEVVDQPRRVLLADRELELAAELVGVAEQDDRVVVAGHGGEVLERVDGGVEAPEGREVARDLLLHRRGGLQEVPASETSLVSETIATWSVSGTSTPFVGGAAGRT